MRIRRWQFKAYVRYGLCMTVVMCSLPMAAYAGALTGPAPHAAAEQGAGPSSNAARVLPQDALWLNPGFYAWHFQKDRNLNNRASGFGAEYRISETGAFTAGVYHNSNWGFSHYLAYYWRPLSWGRMRFGAVAGVLDGYPGTRHGGWFPAVLPTASLEYGRIGLNMFYIPSYQESINGSITLQIKLRVF